MKKIINLYKRITKEIAYYALFSPILKKTNWYKNLFIEDIYPGNIWYREHDERNFDLVVLGSSSAKWAFDFSDLGIKAMNWAQQPQTLVEDYNLLRNFHSILRKGGIVIITIMPFTSLNKQTGLRDALKYQKVHSHEPIQPYLYQKARHITEIPVLMGIPAIKGLIKYLIGKDEKLRTNANAQCFNNLMNQEQLEQNALSFVNGWKQQFNITDFDAPLTEDNKKGREYRIKLMQTIIDFCIERSYRPVFVIPPVTKHLSKFYTPAFEETYIYSFLRDVNRDIPILDYSKNDNLQKDDLYFNSFFMNQKGRKLFTKQVLSDIGLSK